MKLTLNEPIPVVQPPKTVTLELTGREFAMLYDLARSNCGIDVAMSANEALNPERNFSGTEAAIFLCSIGDQGSQFIKNFKL